MMYCWEKRGVSVKTRGSFALFVSRPCHFVVLSLISLGSQSGPCFELLSLTPRSCCGRVVLTVCTAKLAGGMW
jgi:hypothetical protein